MAGEGPFRNNRKGGSPADGSGVPADGAAPGGSEAWRPPTAAQSAAAGRAGGRGRGMARLAGRGATKVGQGAMVGLATLAERLAENAPRIPVRDLPTLRAQFPGLDAEQLADKLVAGAAKSSAAVGASIGAVAALPMPPAMIVELTTETLAVAAVEIKLIAELHEVYGQRAPGNATQRAYAYLGSWANRRGVDVLKVGSLTSALSGQLKRELRQKLLRRTLRNVPTLTPYMVGATIGGVVNRRDTLRLALFVRADLRTRAVPWDKLDLPPLEAPDALEPADSPRPERSALPRPKPWRPNRGT
ncbi:hypothetical protein [Wenjunlia tyrosinilytica]|uniref:Uncharacterized protein n=1 Tax=Wenjunlia tyrosinilytica TaxID=1544741 RepID=A0A918DY82_9ACTN|nr:hypothetical protein [Wenjunlia tyrosinilytica]GGO91262.1 hypothetical protein GCM10012280_38700 [Wenjunlia tyrosinilytica]